MIWIVGVIVVVGIVIFLFRKMISQNAPSKVQSNSSIVGYTYDDFVAMMPDRMWDELSKLYGESVALEFLKTQILINKNKAKNIQYKSPQEACLLIEGSNQLQTIYTVHSERKEIPQKEIMDNDLAFGELIIELTRRRVDYFRFLCEQAHEYSLNDLSKLIHKVNEMIAHERNEFWRRSVVDVKNMIYNTDLHLNGGNHKLIHFNIILKHLVSSAKISAYNRHIIERAISPELENHNEESGVVFEPYNLTSALGVPFGSTRSTVKQIVAKQHPQTTEMSSFGNLLAIPGGTCLLYMGYDWMESDCSVRFHFVHDRLWYVAVVYDIVEINSIEILADKLMTDYPDAIWETVNDQTMRVRVGRDTIEITFTKDKNRKGWKVEVSFCSYYYMPLVIA